MGGKLSYADRLVAVIMDNVVLEVANVHVQYEDETTLQYRPFTFGLSLGSLTMRTTNANGHQV